MCRLFALSAGRKRVDACFWLLYAPDSLRRQSHRNPDGTGLGTFAENGRPVLERQPIPAWRDAAFAAEARTRSSSTFLAHVRRATIGGVAEVDTHPFELDGRLFAHNGVVEGLPDLEAHLGADLALVRGATDSERVFALIAREIRDAGGDVGAGITVAVRWIAEHLPVYALNIVLTTPHDDWALRYPLAHDLLILDRAGCGRTLRQIGSHGTIRVDCGHLADHPAVVVASEAMDDDPGWRHLEPGVLVHIDSDLVVHDSLILPDPPRHRLTHDDLGAVAAAAQGIST